MPHRETSSFKPHSELKLNQKFKLQGHTLNEKHVVSKLGLKALLNQILICIELKRHCIYTHFFGLHYMCYYACTQKKLHSLMNSLGKARFSKMRDLCLENLICVERPMNSTICINKTFSAHFGQKHPPKAKRPSQKAGIPHFFRTQKSVPKFFWEEPKQPMCVFSFRSA